MSKREKAILRLRQNPNNVRFDELDAILLGLGLEKRQRGSHATYTLPGSPIILTIPHRKPFILPIYVKHVLQILDELDLLDD